MPIIYEMTDLPLLKRMKSTAEAHKARIEAELARDAEENELDIPLTKREKTDMMYKINSLQDDIIEVGSRIEELEK